MPLTPWQEQTNKVDHYQFNNIVGIHQVKCQPSNGWLPRTPLKQISQIAYKVNVVFYFIKQSVYSSPNSHIRQRRCFDSPKHTSCRTSKLKIQFD